MQRTNPGTETLRPPRSKWVQIALLGAMVLGLIWLDRAQVVLILKVIALAVAVLGFLVWKLFELHMQLRAELTTRVHGVEDLREPFASRLAQSSGINPLKRVCSVSIFATEAFWCNTLQLSPADLKALGTPAAPHSQFCGANVREFGERHYEVTRIMIQEWRGDYRHIEVHGPFGTRESAELYPGQNCHRLSLWSVPLSSRHGPHFSLELLQGLGEWSISLIATGDAHVSALSAAAGVEMEDVFFTIPLNEGIRAKSFYKPHYTVKTTGLMMNREPPVWERCYQNVDAERGVAWRLWVHDCELFARAEGGPSRAAKLLIQDYQQRAREIAAYDKDPGRFKEEMDLYNRLAVDLAVHMEAQRADWEHN